MWADSCKLPQCAVGRFGEICFGAAVPQENLYGYFFLRHIWVVEFMRVHFKHIFRNFLLPLCAAAGCAFLPTNAYGDGIEVVFEGESGPVCIVHSESADGPIARLELDGDGLDLEDVAYAIKFDGELQSHVDEFLGPMELRIGRGDHGAVSIDVGSESIPSAVAIDLNGVRGSKKFQARIAMEDPSSDHRISLFGGDMAAAVGVADCVRRELASSGWSFMGMDAMGVISCGLGQAVAFGGCRLEGDEKSLCRWAFGQMGDGAIVSLSASCAAAFGASRCRDAVGSLCDWTFDGFVGRGLLLSGGAVSSSLFGVGAVEGVCESLARNWTFGNFEGVKLISCGSSTAVFGAGSGCGPSSFDNWSVEFRGSQTVAAIGLQFGGGGECNANCLGGYGNGNMRFYFNGIGGGEFPPVVSLAAVRVAEIADGEADDEIIKLSGSQGDSDAEDGWGERDLLWTKALSMGDGFQFNVGRTRLMVDGWREEALAGEACQTANGGWETDDSVASGGVAAGGGGTINVIGAIGRAPSFAVNGGVDLPEDTAMRIDGGWTVNCFGPVRDLRTIDLVDGSLVLVNCESSSNSWKIFSDAVGAFGGWMNSNDIGLGVQEEGELQESSGSSSGDGDFLVVNCDGYPVRGSLAIGGGDTLRYHISLDSLAGLSPAAGEFFAIPPDGFIKLCGSADAMVRFDGEWNLQVESVSLPWNALLVLLVATDPAPASAIGGLSIGECLGEYPVLCNFKPGSDFSAIGSSIKLFKLGGATGNRPEDYELYWFENSSIGGIAIGHFAAPLRAFAAAAASLALEKEQIVDLVRNVGTGPGEGPFFGTVALHTRRNVLAASGLGSNGNGYGVVLGERRRMSSRADDIYGSIFIGSTSVKTTYDGPAVLNVFNSRRSECTFGVGVQWLRREMHAFGATAHATLSVSSGTAKEHRENLAYESYDGKMSDLAVQLDLGASRDVLSCGRVQLGCIGDVRLSSIRQGRTVEKSRTSSPNGCIKIDPAKHNFVTAELGVAAMTSQIASAQLSGKLCWRCAAFRSKARASAAVFCHGYGEDFHYGSRNGATVSIGGIFSLGADWSGNLRFESSFLGDCKSYGAAMSFGRSF
ncbi:MAG: hypothetical protein LBI39_03945 [Puniceicoccales bacterium]|jgi:hypothetical protein|nr:hypothetical protein [Puniceicoccales bacterium]